MCDALATQLGGASNRVIARDPHPTTRKTGARWGPRDRVIAVIGNQRRHLSSGTKKAVLILDDFEESHTAGEEQ